LLALGLFTDARPQQALRLGLFDAYQRWSPRERLNDGVVIVAIDEPSLRRLGQWPWPRSQMAALIRQIAAQQPAGIALDIVFAEPDRLSPTLQAKALQRAGEAEAATALAGLPEPDQLFAQALAEAPVVLCIAGVAHAADGQAGVAEPAPVLIDGDDPSRSLPRFPAELRSLPMLDAAATGHGLINNLTDDGVVRQVPALVHLSGRLQPGLSVELLRIATGGGPLRLGPGAASPRQLTVGDYQLPLDAQARWWLHYSPWQQRPHLSAAAVLAGEIEPGLLQGRLVLIGYTALGLLDTVTTPLGLMPGVETHAEALDNLIDGRLLSRPTWALSAERMLGLLLAALALLAVSSFQPLPTLGGLLILAGTLLAGGFSLFQRQGWLLDPASPLLMSALFLSGLLALTVADVQTQRRRLRVALALSREAQARIEGELNAAKRIQLGMLPTPEPLLASHPGIDLAACMRPARSVGGDLYDFFALPDGRLFVLVGDVSGKGLPASLFMALSKALIHSAALQVNGDPARALAEANAALSRDNPEMLFITAIALVLDVHRGALQWCSAGHGAPWLLRREEAARCLHGDGGPPLCVLDDFPYRNEALQLQLGDTLLLGTDGITEAENRHGDFFGTAGLERWLASQPSAHSCAALLTSLEAAVDGFTDGAEAADDLTALLLRWRGPPGLSER
jgi:CHASE2 domain-containing sensor protein